MRTPRRWFDDQLDAGNAHPGGYEGWIAAHRPRAYLLVWPMAQVAYRLPPRKRTAIVDYRVQMTWQAGDAVGHRRMRWWSPADLYRIIVDRDGWRPLVYHGLRRWGIRAEERDRRRGRWV